jgi:Ca-activated chloride channel family protein
MFNVILLIFLALFDGVGSISKIAKENALKKEAEEAFNNKDFKTAIAKFSYLTDTLKVADENATLNLGHAYYKLNDLGSASKTYERLFTSTNNDLRSVAAQQLGIISFKEDKDKDKALTYFKEALRANPANAEARYNYELLKKMQNKKEDPKMDDKKDQDKKDQDKKEDEKKDQDKKDDQNKDKKDGDKGDKKDDKGKDGEKDKKDGKDGKDGKDKKDEKGKDGDKGDKKDDKGKDKKDGKGDKSDKEDDKKNGKDKEGGNQNKEENEKAKEDKKGENAQGKDDKKDGKEGDQGQAMKEKQGGKKEKEKMVANPEILAKMGMTDARAKMLLDAMKGSEVQYIQQVKRETSNNKKKQKGKPDW